MRRRGRWLLVFLCACGGSGIPAIEDIDAGSLQDASIPGDDAGGSGDSSVGVDGSGGRDTGSDAVATDAGADARDAAADAPADTGVDAPLDAAIDAKLVSDPGAVECGTMKCDTTTDLCCVSGNGTAADGGRARTCEDAGLLACIGGTTQRCDEAADCKNNEICCGRLTLGGVGTTSCESKQIGCIAAVQVCATDQECPQGGTCVPHVCGTRVVGTCGPVSNFVCP